MKKSDYTVFNFSANVVATEDMARMLGNAVLHETEAEAFDGETEYTCIVEHEQGANVSRYFVSIFGVETQLGADEICGMIDYVLHGLKQVPLQEALDNNCDDTLVLTERASLSFNDASLAECSNPDCAQHAHIH